MASCSSVKVATGADTCSRERRWMCMRLAWLRTPDHQVSFRDQDFGDHPLIDGYLYELEQFVPCSQPFRRRCE